MSDEERNKKDTTQFLEGVFNQHDLFVYDELIADDFTEHEEIPGFGTDKAGSRQWFEAMFQAFPDFRVVIRHAPLPSVDETAERYPTAFAV